MKEDTLLDHFETGLKTIYWLYAFGIRALKQ